MYHIEQITPELTWEIRRNELYPDLPIIEMGMQEDADGWHFGLFTENKLIAVVSTFLTDEAMQFRKFATDRTYQNKGVGSYLLNFITDYARKENKSLLWCNARESAIGFYKKHGFRETNDTFSRSGINFIIMTKELNVS